MNIKFINSCVIILFFAFGCAETSTTVKEIRKISINIDSIEPAIYSNLFEIEKVVMFDSSYIVANIKKIESWDNNILVHCAGKINQLVLKDTDTGRTIKIGVKGKGPSEYLKISDFFVDKESNEIEVLDGKLGKVLIYDMNGKYIDEFTNENLRFAHSFYKIDNNRIAVYGGISFYGRENYRLIIFDIDSGKILDRFSEISDTQAKFMNFIEASNFTNDGLFHYKYNNQLYNLNTDKIRPVMELDFGIKTLPKSILLDNYQDVREFSEFCKKTTYAYAISSILKSENSFYFSFLYKEKRIQCIYNLNSGKYVVFNKFTNDIFGVELIKKTDYLDIPRGIEGDALYYVVEPFQAKTYLEELKLKLSKNEWKTYFDKRKSWINLFDSLHFDSNSVLIKVKIKNNQ